MSEHAIVRAGVGRKFQTPSIYENLTVLENLEVSYPAGRGVLGSLVFKRSTAVLQKIHEIAAQEDELRQTLEMQKSSVRNYLFFAGRCQEALDFYTQHLGAKVEFKMHFNESPEPMPADMLQKGFENKIMHAAFKVGDVTILASDGCNDTDTFSGFSLALTVPNEPQAHRVFNALAQDGKVVMPLAKVFWSPLYGQVTDKFGVAWMIMLPDA